MQAHHIYICDFHKNMIHNMRVRRKRKGSDGDGDDDADKPDVSPHYMNLLSHHLLVLPHIVC